MTNDSLLHALESAKRVVKALKAEVDRSQERCTHPKSLESSIFLQLQQAPWKKV